MEKKFKRILDVNLPNGQSLFLFGARKTGKSTFLKEKFPNAYYIDLLNNDNLIEYTNKPSLLYERIAGLPAKTNLIIIDEAQKIPTLLNEVHRIIEDLKKSFILCGSSARKLKKSGTNLLGGRAWNSEMLPLSWQEIEDFDILKAFNQGLIPSHYLSENPDRSLKSYVNDYLKEEIRDEGLSRNLPAFSKFLEAIAFTQGELVNYTNIARECGVDSKTVKEYFQITVDTLIGYLIEPYTETPSRQIISSTNKFYLFDLGVANFLSFKKILALKGSEAGHSFEHFIFLELIAYRSYANKNTKIRYWRTKHGLEVDFIVGNRSIDVAIEVKITDSLPKNELIGLIQLAKSVKIPPKKLIVVCNEKELRVVKLDNISIYVYPYQVFLKELWENKIF